MDHKLLSFKLEVKEEDDGVMAFEGYAAFFGNEDSHGDVIAKGAFTKTLKEQKNIKLLSMHNSYDLPLGVITELKADAKGLFLKAELAETQKGKETYSLLKMGALDGLSIGFYPIKITNNKDGTRTLNEVKLVEVSVVTWPSNPKTLISAVKSMDEDMDAGDVARALELLAAEKAKEAEEKELTEGLKALSEHIKG